MIQINWSCRTIYLQNNIYFKKLMCKLKEAKDLATNNVDSDCWLWSDSAKLEAGLSGSTQLV